jgi:hypothetical protein
MPTKAIQKNPIRGIAIANIRMAIPEVELPFGTAYNAMNANKIDNSRRLYTLQTRTGFVR